MKSAVNATTMPPGSYDMRHIVQWSVLMASCEANKRHHWASTHVVLARQTPRSSSSSSLSEPGRHKGRRRRRHRVKTQRKTMVLPNNYRTFLLVVCENFITRRGPPTQLIGHACRARAQLVGVFLQGWGDENWWRNWFFRKLKKMVAYSDHSC